MTNREPSSIEHLPECQPEDMTVPDEEGIRDCLRCGLWETAEDSVERSQRRKRYARDIAIEKVAHLGDDVEIEPPDEDVEYVDGGYWVKARVFVYFEDVEERMP